MAPTPTPSGSQERENARVMEFCSTTETLQWAKFGGALRPNEPKDVTVKLTVTNGPDEIYVVKAESEEAINDLHEQLEYSVSELIAGMYWDYATLFRDHYQSGICVAAKDIEDSWARALVLKVHDEGEERKMDVFFVDHGDVRYGVGLKDVFPLSRRFLEQLEFQAIALNLDHIKPAHANGVWTKRVVNFMDAILINAKNKISHTLEIVALTKIGTAGQGQEGEVVPKCNRYNAFVFTDTERELGETLVRINLARFKDEQGYENKKGAIIRELAAKYAKLLPPGVFGRKVDAEEEEEGGGAAGVDRGLSGDMGDNPLHQLGKELAGFDFYEAED